MRKVLSTVTSVLIIGFSGIAAAPADAGHRGGGGGHHGGFNGGGALLPGVHPPGGLGASARPHGFNNVGRFHGFGGGQFHGGQLRNSRFNNGRFNNGRSGRDGVLFGDVGYYGSGYYDGYGASSGSTTQAVYVDTSGVRQDPVAYRAAEPATPACFTVAKVWNAQLRRNLDQTVRHAC
jgi:hypothetical protein